MSWPCQLQARASIATRRPVSGATSQNAAEIARYYDLDVANERDDIDVYLALASATDGPILEFACGSGRICVPLAAAGHDVVGVDIEAAMLDRARTAWRDAGSGLLQLVEGDVTTVDLNQRFDLVILGFNSLLVIGSGDPEAQLASLKNMARHMTQDGLAVIDTWLPSADDLEIYDGREVREWTRTDPQTGDEVTKSVSAVFDPQSRRATIDTHFETARGRITRQDVVHFPTRDELLDMVESAGLEPQQVAGGYDMAPLGPESERVVIVAAVGPVVGHSTPDSAA